MFKDKAFYSGHVKYEPPPVSYKSSSSIVASTDHWQLNATTSDSNSTDLGRCSKQSEITIKPHSLRNFEIHTYENVTPDSQRQRYSETASVIIENKYTNSKSRPSSLSSQESKSSSPRNSHFDNITCRDLVLSSIKDSIESYRQPSASDI